MNYMYSATTNVFYPVELLDSYPNLPEDLVYITDEEYAEFERSHLDKVRVPGPDGHPTWGPVPDPDEEEQKLRIQIAIHGANVYINSHQWPGKAALGILTDEERAEYILWINYIDMVRKLDPKDPKMRIPEPPSMSV